MALIYDFAYHKRLEHEALKLGKSYRDLKKYCMREGISLEKGLVNMRRNKINASISATAIFTGFMLLYFNTNFIQNQINHPKVIYSENNQGNRIETSPHYDKALKRGREEILEELLI